MSAELDPQLEAAARRRLTQLFDAIEVGPTPKVPALPEDDMTDVTNQTARKDFNVVDLGTIPHPTPTSTRRHRRPLLYGLAAGAAAALLFGAAVLLRGDGDGKDTTGPSDTTPSRAVPHLVPGTELPLGIGRRDGGDLPIPAKDLDPGSVTFEVYGDAASPDQPFADGDLGVIVVQDETVGMGGNEVTVRGGPGRTGVTSHANDVGIPDTGTPFQWVSWNETDDVEVTLASRRLSMGTLRTLAETAVVKGTEVTIDTSGNGELLGLTKLGTLAQVTFGGATLVPGAAPGHLDTYGASADGPLSGPIAQIATYTDATGDDLRAIQWVLGTSAQEIGGRQVYWQESAASGFGDGQAQQVSVFAWQEDADTVAVVVTVGFFGDQALAMVNGLHEQAE